MTHTKALLGICIAFLIAPAVCAARITERAEIERDFPIRVDNLSSKALQLLDQRFPGAKPQAAIEGEREGTNLLIMRVSSEDTTKLLELTSTEEFFATEENENVESLSPEARDAVMKLQKNGKATSIRRMERVVHKVRIRRGNKVDEYLITPSGNVYKAIAPTETDFEEERRHDQFLLGH